MTVLYKESIILSEEQSHWLELRGWVYQLLMDFLNRPPRMSLLGQWVRRIEQRNTMPNTQAGLKLKHYLESIESKDFRKVFGEVEAEYKRLFMGSEAIKTCEGAYMQDSDEYDEFNYRMAIRSLYLEAGVVFNKLSGERDDHIAMELEFMAVLSQEILEKQPFRQKCLEIADLQIRFMENHLLKWAHLFSENLASSTTSPLYQGVAELISEFLTYDYHQLCAWRECQE